MKKLPKKLFASIRNKGTEDEFLLASTDISDIPDQNERCAVGVYVLEKEIQIINKTVIEGTISQAGENDADKTT